jgi:phosphoglycerate dehydrogenase-like enzyme
VVINLVSTVTWRPRVVLAMSGHTQDRLFTPRLADRLRAVADVDLDVRVEDFAQPEARAATILEGAEILLTGWGAPRVAARALDLMPRLRAVVHAAGSVKFLIAPEVFERGIQVTTSADANAVPVAEFTFATIVYAAKRADRFARAYHAHRDGGQRGDVGLPPDAIGANDITVGIVGASRVGRRVLDLLKHLSVDVLITDPYLSRADAEALGTVKTTLDDLMARSDIISLHAPALPETKHLIGRDQLAVMRDNAVLINTARGALIDTEALIDELRSGRIEAVLDVTDPEPLPADSPLFELPNVRLTPHIAGALGNEVPRLLQQAIGEIERLAAGQPLSHPVTAADLARIA